MVGVPAVTIEHWTPELFQTVILYIISVATRTNSQAATSLQRSICWGYSNKFQSSPAISIRLPTQCRTNTSAHRRRHLVEIWFLFHLLRWHPRFLPVSRRAQATSTYSLWPDSEIPNSCQSGTKCVFMVSKVTFLGYKVSVESSRPMEEWVTHL
jgi:hypothetical protein